MKDGSSERANMKLDLGMCRKSNNSTVGRLQSSSLKKSSEGRTVVSAIDDVEEAARNAEASSS
jgi:hypothetical protein